MILIQNAHIMPIVGPELPNGCLLAEDGRITAVAPHIDAPEGCTVIDADGRLLTPGCVEAHCHIGLDNECLRWEGMDYNEIVEPLTPQLRRQGFHDLIVVHALPAQTLIVQTDVTVGLHAAGGQQTAVCVDDGAALRGVDVGGNGGDAAILRQQAAVGQLRPDDGHDVGVLNEDHGDPSCFHRLG